MLRCCSSVRVRVDTDAYTTEDLVFDWRKDAVPVERNKGIRLPEYDLKGVSHMVCDQNINSTGEHPFSTSLACVTRCQPSGGG